MPRTRLGRADKASASRRNRTYLRRRRIRCTIPVEIDRVRNCQQHGSRSGRPPRFDLTDHRERHAVECGINRLKEPALWLGAMTRSRFATRPLERPYPRLLLRWINRIAPSEVGLARRPSRGSTAKQAKARCVGCAAVPTRNGNRGPADGREVTAEVGTSDPDVARTSHDGGSRRAPRMRQGSMTRYSRPRRTE